MKTVLSRTQARRVDQIAIEQFGIPGIVLMENAGRGCVEELLKRKVKGGVVICCGPGNNGGDGFVIARHLDNAGIKSKIFLWGQPEKIAGDARINLEIVQNMKLPIVKLDELTGDAWREEIETVSGVPTEWIVDALLGTGATGPPRTPMDKLIESINSADAKRMAIDIPTGIDCDTGIVHTPAIRADVTCSFVAEKPAFANPAAAANLGAVQIIDIGVPKAVIRQVLEV